LRPEGPIGFVGVAQQSDFERFEKAFSDLLNSVPFTRIAQTKPEMERGLPVFRARSLLKQLTQKAIRRRIH
jgi:hypothetical protein